MEARGLPRGRGYPLEAIAAEARVLPRPRGVAPPLEATTADERWTLVCRMRTSPPPLLSPLVIGLEVMLANM